MSNNSDIWLCAVDCSNLVCIYFSSMWYCWFPYIILFLLYCHVHNKFLLANKCIRILILLILIPHSFFPHFLSHSLSASVLLPLLLPSSLIPSLTQPHSLFLPHSLTSCLTIKSLTYSRASFTASVTHTALLLPPSLPASLNPYSLPCFTPSLPPCHTNSPASRSLLLPSLTPLFTPLPHSFPCLTHSLTHSLPCNTLPHSSHLIILSVNDVKLSPLYHDTPWKLLSYWSNSAFAHTVNSAGCHRTIIQWLQDGIRRASHSRVASLMPPSDHKYAHSGTFVGSWA